MRIESKSLGKVTLVSLAGDLERGEAAHLRARLRGARNVVLNVRRVRFVDVAGLDALAAVARRLRAAGGRLVLSEPSRVLRRTLSAVGLDRAMRPFDRNYAAASFLRRELDDRARRTRPPA